MARDDTNSAAPGEAPTTPVTRRGSGPKPDHCRQCRYPLIGLAEDIPCPECGSRIRQAGPHRILETNEFGAVTCAGTGCLMLLVVCAGEWYAIFFIPILGLIALIYGKLEARSRRGQNLPRSRVTLVTSILGWFLLLPPIALLIFGFIVW